MIRVHLTRGYWKPTTNEHALCGHLLSDKYDYFTPLHAYLRTGHMHPLTTCGACAGKITPLDRLAGTEL